MGKAPQKTMTEAISHFFLNIVGRELCVFFCAMLPIIELRGAIPLGAGLGLPLWQTLLLSFGGNLLPVPFILLFIRTILRWMKECRWQRLRRFALWLEKKAEKNKGKIEKYEYLGLFLFVAIPIPGTGAWTGSLIAALLQLDLKKSLLFVLLGILLAGGIMSALSYGVVSVIAAL